MAENWSQFSALGYLVAATHLITIACGIHKRCEDLRSGKMIPISHKKQNFLVLACSTNFLWCWLMDNQATIQTISALGLGMRVVPAFRRDLGQKDPYKTSNLLTKKFQFRFRRCRNGR